MALAVDVDACATAYWSTQLLDLYQIKPRTDEGTNEL